MSRRRSFAPLLVKETRALLPVWAGTMVALAVAFVWPQRSISDLGLLSYVGGVISLGAHAIGHEYGHRALPMLLAQPVPRRRLLAAKFTVSIAMIGTVALAATMVFRSDAFRGNDAVSTVALPILAGIFLTPLFTMICRNTLAGAVLGASAPMTLWVITMIVAWWAFGIEGDVITNWLMARWPILATVVCPFLAVLTWRAFHRLEAIDGTPVTLTLPRWLGARAGARRAAPWRALFVKELHLQQMTIAITLFYGVIWTIGVALRDTMPAAVALPFDAVLLLYCMGLAVVIGALASAEERQQGTLEIQLLQPVSALGQWAVKCAVALSLAAALGFILPVVLITAFSASTSVNPSPSLLMLVVVLTASSLYISSLVGSGVKAMTWSLPVGVLAALFIQTTQTAIASASTQLGTPLGTDQTEAITVILRLLPVLIVPALLWFGFVNHTSTEHPVRRTLAQTGALAIVVVAVIAAAGALI